MGGERTDCSPSHHLVCEDGILIMISPGEFLVESQVKPVVAILDDEDAYRKLISQFFSDLGYRVVEMSKKEKFLESLGENPPDVIITDVLCSPMDGLTFLQKIKADERYEDIPVIFATGYRSLHLLLYKHGAFAVITKPLDIEELKACVQRALVPFATS